MTLAWFTNTNEPDALRVSHLTGEARTKGRQWDTPSRRRAARDAPDRVRWERAA